MKRYSLYKECNIFARSDQGKERLGESTLKSGGPSPRFNQALHIQYLSLNAQLSAGGGKYLQSIVLKYYTGKFTTSIYMATRQTSVDPKWLIQKEKAKRDTHISTHDTSTVSKMKLSKQELFTRLIPFLRLWFRI